MTQITRLEKFKVPLTGQEIELQQVDYEGGGVSQLRIRIRERSRFTTVDVDPLTARHWGDALRQWAERQEAIDALPGDGRAPDEARDDGGSRGSSDDG